MTAAELVTLEAKLVEACEWVQENGWRIVSHQWGSTADNTCCPVGALAVFLGYGPSAYINAAVEAGFTNSGWFSVGAGFDGDIGWGQHTEYPEQYAIGARLRSRFLGDAK